MSVLQEFAPDVARLQILFVNVYFVGAPGAYWVLVDTGVPGFAEKIRAAARKRFGERPPQAIVLTHGHYDHAGNARELAEAWDVPIYAHSLELPFLDGREDYPPRDPTVGGAIAFLSRFMSSKGFDLGPHLKVLSGDDEIELLELPGWKIFHTPGHSPGHVSIFRERASTLLAGDAFATMNMDSWLGMTTMRQDLGRAGTPFNCNWQATKHSVEKLANLRATHIGCGHGHPMTTQEYSLLVDDLEIFAEEFEIPSHGRYADPAAHTDERGVLFVPPPAADPLVPVAAGVGVAAAALLLLKYRRRG